MTYKDKVEGIFKRFPSVQNSGFKDAYKPGLDNMLKFSAILGSPERDYRTVHVAGTNGKGSVANMLASALAASGLKVGLYTSPHIIDFRERMRIIEGQGPAELVEEDYVMDFICKLEDTFDELSLSFFEITTGMAFKWFSDSKIDIAIIEVGLGGRLDSTNIITPELSVVTSIGLDHCALLGDSRKKIAGEKAGIIKKGVPAVVGVNDEETAAVFEDKARSEGSRLIFADSAYACAPLSSILDDMDLKGAYQADNLRTVLASLDVLGISPTPDIMEALAHTASRMGFHGRWECIGRKPDIICDIGHNPPALARNFKQLSTYLSDGIYSDIIIVYGVMADKDLDGIIPLMPLDAIYVTVAPDTARALKADKLYWKCHEELCKRGLPEKKLIDGGSVEDGVAKALKLASSCRKPLIYIGGSTFVVSEAMQLGILKND